MGLMMEELVRLLIAATLGGIVGWLLRSRNVRNQLEDNEVEWQERLGVVEEESRSLRTELSEQMARNKLLDADLAAAEKRLDSIDGELKQEKQRADELENNRGKVKGDLRAKLEQLSASREQAVVELAEKAGMVGKLRAELADRTARVEKLRRDLAARTERQSQRLAELQAELDELRQVRDTTEFEVPPAKYGLTAPPVDGIDDLKSIRGVGKVMEQLLHEQGIYKYRQIASWTEHDIEEVSVRLDAFRGRIERDGWVEQARQLLGED